jgi:hypothetical protein
MKIQNGILTRNRVKLNNFDKLNLIQLCFTISVLFQFGNNLGLISMILLGLIFYFEIKIIKNIIYNAKNYKERDYSYGSVQGTPLDDY